jgi:hypothetical protein
MSEQWGFVPEIVARTQISFSLASAFIRSSMVILPLADLFTFSEEKAPRM